MGLRWPADSRIFPDCKPATRGRASTWPRTSPDRRLDYVRRPARTWRSLAGWCSSITNRDRRPVWRRTRGMINIVRRPPALFARPPLGCPENREKTNGYWRGFSFGTSSPTHVEIFEIVDLLVSFRDQRLDGRPTQTVLERYEQHAERENGNETEQHVPRSHPQIL